MNVALKYLLDNWKNSLLVAAGVALLTLGLGYRSTLIAKGKAEERSRTADSISHALDSTLKAQHGLMAKVDTVWAHDTVRFAKLYPKLMRDTAWLHDTVRVAGDTTARLAVPVSVVLQAQTALKECRSLIGDCDQRVAAREGTITTLTRDVGLWKYQAAHPPPTSCVWNDGISGALGAIGGFFIGRGTKK